MITIMISAFSCLANLLHPCVFLDQYLTYGGGGHQILVGLPLSCGKEKRRLNSAHVGQCGLWVWFPFYLELTHLFVGVHPARTLAAPTFLQSLTKYINKTLSIDVFLNIWINIITFSIITMFFYLFKYSVFDINILVASFLVPKCWFLSSRCEYDVALGWVWWRALSFSVP